MAGKFPVSSELSRELTLFQITMMGLGMMIGAGVFLGVGNAVRHAGPGGVMLTFVLNGVIAMMTACSYAELCSAIPQTGGAYNYLRLGFGRGTSFLGGWMEWFASSVAGSLYSVTFAIYVVRFLHGLELINWMPISLPASEKALAVLIAGLFIYINFRGASETGKIGALMTLGQTLFLVMIGLVGLFVVFKDPSRLNNFSPFLPMGWSKLLVTMGFTYVAFEGFEVIAQAGDEVIEPRKNLPKAMLYSVLIVTVTYTLTAFATMVSVHAASSDIDGPVWKWIGQYGERGFGEAISRLIPLGNFLLTLAVIFASTSALNATLYSATRALYALGRDRMIPPVVAKISKKRKTPWVALLFTAVLVVSVATLLPTMDVASCASMMFIILFFLVNICVIRVRTNMGDELTYGFVMPFFPVLPILAITAQVVLAVWLIHLSLIAWIVAPLWIVCGVLIYQFYAKSHSIDSVFDLHILEEEKSASKNAYRVMLAVANPQNALEMVKTTRKLSQAKEAEIDLIHMVPVPDQIPLSDAEAYMLEGKEAIVESMLYLTPSATVRSTIRYCRSVARGIVSTVREKKIDLLIIGWRGDSRSRNFFMGSTVDPIIERAPCHVLVLKEGHKQAFRKVLMPVAGGGNEGLALEMAEIFSRDDQGQIDVLHIPQPKKPFDIHAYIDIERKRLGIPENRIRILVRDSENVVETVLNASRHYDLLIIGTSRRSWLQQIRRTTIAETIASRCEKPVVMVKAAARLESLVKRYV